MFALSFYKKYDTLYYCSRGEMDITPAFEAGFGGSNPSESELRDSNGPAGRDRGICEKQIESLRERSDTFLYIFYEYLFTSN